MSAPAKFFGSNPNKASAVVDVTQRNGSLFVNDTARHIYETSVLEALSAAVVNIESAPGPGCIQGTLTAVPIPAGSRVVGRIQAFTCASGNVIAYA